MKNKLILKDGLPFKYYLGLQSIVNEYPTTSDFVFECVNFVLAKNKKQTFEKGITFSKSSLKDVFGERLQDTVFLKSLKTIIKDMLSCGSLLKPDEESLTIPRETIMTLYTID